MKLYRYVLGFLIVVFCLCQSLFAFASDTTDLPKIPYEAANHLVADTEYYNIKNPSSVTSGDLAIGGADYSIVFISDDDTGIVYAFCDNAAIGDFVISNTNILRPARLRIFLKRYLLVLDRGSIHVFDFDTDTALYGYAGKVEFSADTVSVKDFFIKPVSAGMPQLYVITTSDKVFQYALSVPSFICASAGDVINIPGGDQPIALNCLNDYTYILCKYSYARFYMYANSIEVFYPIIDNPNDIAIIKAGAEELVLISDADGISAYRGSIQINSNPRTIKNTAVDYGEFSSPNAMSLDGNALYVADTSTRAKCVQRFYTDAHGVLSYGNFFVGGRGGQYGRLFAPSGIALSDSNIYIADTENKRIQIWERANDSIRIIDMRTLSIAGRTMECSPVFISASPDGTIYATTKNNLVVAFDNSGTLLAAYSGAGGQNFSGLSAINTDKAGNVYILDEGNKAVYKKTPSGTDFVSIISGLNSPTAITVTNNNKIYIADKNALNAPVIKVFDLNGAESSAAASITIDSSLNAVTAIAVDDRDSIFLFADSAGESRFLRYLLKMNNSGQSYYEPAEFVLTNDSLRSVKSIAICPIEGNLFIADTANNVIKRASKGGLGIFILDEAPQNLAPPIYIKNNTADADFFHPIDYAHEAASAHDFPEADTVRIGKVVKGGFVFPIESQYIGSDLYPEGYALVGYPEPLQLNELLIVLSDDAFNTASGYVYVLYRGLAGFVSVDSISITPRDLTDRPYENIEGKGLVLYDNVDIFKYPSLEKQGGNYSYILDTLAIDTKVTVVCRVKEFLYNSYFYEIKYCGEGSDPENRDTWQTAFVFRYNITPDSPRNNPAKREGRIKAAVNRGTVPVYEEPNGKISPDLVLRDNMRVEIKSELDGWYEVSWATEDGERSGFIEDTFLIYAGLTAMQVVGIIILVLAIATMVITIWLKKPRKTETPPTDTMRF